MRHGALCALGLMAALGSPSRADWKFTTVYTRDAGDHHTVSRDTEYFKNGVRRSDVVDPALGSRLNFIHVTDLSRMRRTEWSLERREYSIGRLYSSVSPPVKARGQTFVVDVETSDSGERRTMFGREARRLITVERLHMEGAAVDSESRTDGWYIDSKEMPSGLGQSGLAILTFGSGSPIRINHHGVIRTGLAISTKRTNFRIQSNGERSISKDTSEVTELFEGQLDPALFQPPPGFRRVYPSYPTVTWRDKLYFCWDWLQDRLGLP